MKKLCVRVANWFHRQIGTVKSKKGDPILVTLNVDSSAARATIETLRREVDKLRNDAILAAAPFSGLTVAEIERLAMLSEECGEVVMAVGKILRHGYQSQSPYGGPTNRVFVEREIGDVRAVIDMMIDAGDIRPGDIAVYRQNKARKMYEWMHHNS